VAITYRPITKDELVPFFHAQSISFSRDFDPDSPGFESRRQYDDYDRSTAAFDGDTIVGTAGIYSFDLSIPGGAAPTAGVTWVSVRASHRRKGILTGMMRWQMDHVREHGEALAALWASEAQIYGRFGYGLAAEGVEMKIDRTHTDLRHGAPFTGSCRYVSRDEALKSWPEVYDCVRVTQPGMISRPPHWWSLRHLPEPERAMPGYTTSFLAQYEEQGRPLGYVRYRVKESYEDGSSTSTLLVNELIGATPSAYNALWSFIFGVDLIGTITTPWGRSDEPLQHMLADPRRLVRRTQDTLYIRLVDVARALAARKYASEGAVVLEVKDAFCPWNTGRYRLEGGPGGATCAPTDAPAEIALDAETLGATYLGGTRFRSFARAGRIKGDPAVFARADAMFSWDPLPWIPEIF
jgi:predicted acetyltransferase